MSVDQKKEKIAVMTTGGDCAGLNFCIEAIIKRASKEYNYEVIGIHSGTLGLMDETHLDIERLDEGTMPYVQKISGGSILGSQKHGNPFYFKEEGSETSEDVSEEVIAHFKQLDCKALICIGGDGSFSIMSRLAKKGGLPFIGIPKTIDNDIGFTEASIGFHTAVEVATDALDRLHTTAMSHSRIMILEVMGRNTGHIALHAGIAGAADIILLPEISIDFDKLIEEAQKAHARKGYAIIIVAEGMRREDGKRFYTDTARRYQGAGDFLAHYLTQHTKIEVRSTVLGHLQRGGNASYKDRFLAAALGVHAVDLAAAGCFNRMVGWYQQKLIDVAIERVLDFKHRVPKKGAIIKIARSLGIFLGN